MSFIPQAPVDFKYTKVKILPTPKVELSWDQVQSSDIRNDYLYSNDPEQLSAVLGTNPPRISSHLREVVGYELYRSQSINYIPPEQGDLLANEDVLSSDTVTFVDLTVVPNTFYYYKLCAKISE